MLTLRNMSRCHICLKASCAVWTPAHRNRVYVLWDLAQRWRNWIYFWNSFWDLRKLYNPDWHIIHPVCRSLPRYGCFRWLWSIQALTTRRQQTGAWLDHYLQGFLQPLLFLSVGFLDPLEVAAFLVRMSINRHIHSLLVSSPPVRSIEGALKRAFWIIDGHHLRLASNICRILSSSCALLSTFGNCARPPAGPCSRCSSISMCKQPLQAAAERLIMLLWRLCDS